MKVKINLNTIVAYTGSENFDVYFDDCVSFEHGFINPTPPFSLILNIRNDYKYFITEGNETYEYEDNDITTYVSNNYIIIEGTPRDEFYIQLPKLLSLGMIEILEVNDVLISCYKLNCERGKINKQDDLVFVKFIHGNFNHSVGIKKFDIDIEGFVGDEQFNYVYIYNFKRFYYVDTPELITSNITRLHLTEDVLYSWADLIYSQNAFISRYENSEQVNMVDERLPMENVKTIEFLDFINGDLVNCEFDFDIDDNTPIIAITTQSTKVLGAHGSNVAPTGTNLPEIRSTLNDTEYLRFIDFSHFQSFCYAYRSDDSVSSFVESVIYFPFDAETLFELTTSSSTAIFLKDKYINSYGQYVDTSSSDAPLQCYRMPLAKDGITPYIVIADIFYQVDEDTFDLHEPYSNYEIYIPFVSWIPIQFKQFVNQQILVYYAVDFKTGISTAYVYNVTEDYIIWSGTCQLGIKLDMTTTNQIENTKQKQASDLNMILGGMSGMLAMGVGVATGNPIAITGGLLSTGKAVASNVNAHNMIFERAQSSFGTSENALFSPNEVRIRRTYNKKIELDSDDTYKKLNGLPYNNYVYGLGNLSGGYVEIPEIHFNPLGEMIYKDEVDEIVSLLKDGVIL